MRDLYDESVRACTSSDWTRFIQRGVPVESWWTHCQFQSSAARADGDWACGSAASLDPVSEEHQCAVRLYAAHIANTRTHTEMCDVLHRPLKPPVLQLLLTTAMRRSAATRKHAAFVRCCVLILTVGEAVALCLPQLRHVCCLEACLRQAHLNDTGILETELPCHRACWIP